jgi:hypothetical protein
MGEELNRRGGARNSRKHWGKENGHEEKKRQ